MLANAQHPKSESHQRADDCARFARNAGDVPPTAHVICNTGNPKVEQEQEGEAVKLRAPRLGQQIDRLVLLCQWLDTGISLRAVLGWFALAPPEAAFVLLADTRHWIWTCI